MPVSRVLDWSLHPSGAGRPNSKPFAAGHGPATRQQTVAGSGMRLVSAHAAYGVFAVAEEMGLGDRKLEAYEDALAGLGPATDA